MMSSANDDLGKRDKLIGWPVGTRATRVGGHERGSLEWEDRLTLVLSARHLMGGVDNR